MPRRGLLVVALLAGLLTVLLLDLPRSRGQDFRAARYTQIVDGLYLNTHIIGLDDGEAGAGGDGGAQITFHRPADATQARLADWYYKNSYLKGDVQRFNEGSPEGRMLFDVEHGQLAHINPAAHTFRPSLNVHGRWIGKLLYADEGRGSSLTLTALDTGQGLEVLPLAHPFVQEPQSRHGYVTLFGRAAPKPGSIIHFTTADHHEVAHVWAMGDGALLRLITPEPECKVEIRIDGRALHGTGGEVYALGRDSVLLFENHRAQARIGRPAARERRSSAFIVRDQVAPDVAYDGRSGLWQRTPYDPLLPKVQSLLAEVAAGSPRDVDADVRLTLSRSAEESAGGILEAALARPRAGGAPSTAPSAITLMDGISGGLLALPSFPLGAVTQTQASLGSLAEQNQNFTRHSVGSVAKVLFAPAVLDTHPELLTLSLPAAGEEGKAFSSVLGLPLNREVQDDALGVDRLDFVRAVALSSNRFAVTLLTLGSDDPHVSAQGGQEIGTGPDRYYLGGRLMERRPTDLIFNPGTPDSLSVLGLPWVDRMRHLLDVNVATAQDRVTRQYIWDALPAALQPRQRQRRMLDSISPEYENLRMEAIRNRRADFGSKFASLTLGAGESRWTNVALAEAVATLIQNRPVRAQIVAPGDTPAYPEAGPAGYEFRRLGDATHQALGDAMAAVVRYGTASLLEATRADLARAACERREAFGLFAKTGTPVLVEQHEAPESALFNLMARDQLFRRNAEGRILYTGFTTDAAPGGRVVTFQDLALLRHLRDAPAGPVAEHFAGYFRNLPAAVRADVRACHDSRATPRALWFRVMRAVAESNEAPGYAPVRSNGPVLSYNHQCTTTKSPDNHNINGRHIVMLAATYPREAVIGGGTADCLGAAPHIDVSRQPTHAVVAVVAIADPERMDRTLDVAKKLLQGPMAEHLKLPLPPPPPPAPTPPHEGEL